MLILLNIFARIKSKKPVIKEDKSIGSKGKTISLGRKANIKKNSLPLDRRIIY